MRSTFAIRVMLAFAVSALGFASSRALASDLECQDKLEVTRIDSRLRALSERSLVSLDRRATTVGIQVGASVHARATVMSLETATSYFRAFQRDSSLAFNDPRDACFARAHEMAHRMHRDGFESAKAVLTGFLRLRTAKTDSGFVEWSFHVAPAVAVAHGGCNRLMVIDPSIFDRPVTLEEWAEKQLRHSRYRGYAIYYRPQTHYRVDLDHHEAAPAQFIPAELEDARRLLNERKNYFPINRE